MLKVDDNKFLRDEDDNLVAPFVTSFVAMELVYPGASVICCRLWDGTVQQGSEVAAADAHQFRMSPTSARRLAKLLLQCADELEGVDHPQQ